jgi:hypothetical protein
VNEGFVQADPFLPDARTHAAIIRLELAASAQFQERRNRGHLVRRHQLSADRSILLTADGGT